MAGLKGGLMSAARIAGTGLYAPGAPIDNGELARLTGIAFDAQRLEAKIGIKARHIARLRGIPETTADFAEKAGRAALRDAGVEAAEVGLFVVATDTPEYISPATSILLQGRLQGMETESGAFDVGASCASFVTALDVVSRMMMTDRSLRYALVVGVYNMPAYIRPGDEFGWTLFADGAGAVLLAREDEDSSGYQEGVLKADGTQWNFVGVYAGGTRKPVTRELLDAGTWGLELLQKLPGDRNVKLWPPTVRRLLDKAGWRLEQVDHFFFTQINRSVIHQVMGILGLPLEKTTCIMDRFGYTGSACVPMALHTARAEGRVKKGDAVVLVASGAGLAVAASLLRL
jgi:3-oxoacyl-[acyl-carrier-protein] synthase III